MTFRGRHWLLLWLLVFLGTAAAVVARQNDSLRTARRLAELRERRTGLEAHRADLERRIGVASSRGVLVPRAERAGLRFPGDSESVVLRLVPPAGGGR